MPNSHHTLPAMTTPSDRAEEECAICFEAMSESTAVTMPGCTHKFHGECLVKNMLVSRCCPLCRNDPTRPAPEEYEYTRSPEEQREADLFHYEVTRDRAVRMALETPDSYTMDQAKLINKHSIEFYKLDKEAVSLGYEMQKHQADCRKEMMQYRKRSLEQYKTDHCDLLERKTEAVKRYKYTTDQMQNAYYRVAYSAGYGIRLDVLDYSTSLKLASMMPRGDAQTKMIDAWKERRQQSIKEIRIIKAEDIKVRKQINLTVSQELKVIGDKFKQLEDVKSLCKRIAAIRRKQCLIRKKLYAVRDSIAISQGWVRQPDITVNHVLDLRKRDAVFVRTNFFVSRYRPLLQLKNQREYRPLRSGRSIRRSRL